MIAVVLKLWYPEPLKSISGGEPLYFFINNMLKMFGVPAFLRFPNLAKTKQNKTKTVESLIFFFLYWFYYPFVTQSINIKWVMTFFFGLENHVECTG